MDPATRTARRKRIVGLLLTLAVIGAVVRQIAPAGSSVHTLGTLFMVMGVPIVGTVVFWFARKRAPLVPMPHGFADDEPFVAHVMADLASVSTASDRPPDAHAGSTDCMIVVGTEGFTARFRVAADAVPLPNRATRVAVQFRSPRVALPRFVSGTVFAAYRGKQLFAEGTVATVMAEP